MGSYTELRIKEFFSKEILPYLGINNYGYDENIINSMKVLGKLLSASTLPAKAASQNLIYIPNHQPNPFISARPTTQQNPNTKNLLSAFEDPDDPLQMLANVHLPNTFPSTSEMRADITSVYANGHDYKYLENDNVREFGSYTLIPNRPQQEENPEEYVTQFRMDNFPMYDPLTDQIDYGCARSS